MRHHWKAIAACLAGLVFVTPAVADDRDWFKEARKRQREYEKGMREAQKRQEKWVRDQQKRAEKQYREALKRQREYERDRRKWLEERYDDRDDRRRNWPAVPPVYQPYGNPGGYSIPLYPPAGATFPGRYPPVPYGYGLPPTVFPLAPGLPSVFPPYYFRGDDDD